MKTKALFSAIMGSLFICSASINASAQDKSSLTLKISDIETYEGSVLVALFNSQENFSNDNALASKITPVTSEEMEIAFYGIGSGTYAIKLFHDLNKNGELDTGPFGIPSEPYAFSNNASDPFSAPEWEETKFLFNSSNTQHAVSLD